MDRLRDLFRSKRFYIALRNTAGAVLINLLSSVYIWRTYGESLPAPPDLFLDMLPSLELAWLYNLVPVLGFVVFFVLYAYKSDFAGIPFFLLLVGLFCIARGVGIVLTPIAYPNEPFTNFFLIKAFRFGVNPSGHSGSLFLFFLLAKGEYKKLFLTMTVLASVLMLLGEGHYTIDIFSSFFFSYSVYCFGEKHLRYSRMPLREILNGGSG